MPDYDVYINDELLVRDATFRTVTPYASVRGGNDVSVGIKASGSTSSSPYVSVANFAAPINSFFTVGFTGPLPGPDGQVAQNTNPIVNPDMRRVPNPGRGSGLWYRWSETPATIDFRAVAGDPMNDDCNVTCINYLSGGNGCPTCAITTALDVERISDLLAKTVIQLSEFEAGTYSFYPTLPGRNDPLWNVRFNGGAGGVVGVRALEVEGAEEIQGGARGMWYDFWAQGDSLLNANPNNLEVKATVTVVEYDTTNGCTYVLNDAGNRIPSQNMWASSAASTSIAAASAVVALFAGLSVAF